MPPLAGCRIWLNSARFTLGEKKANVKWRFGYATPPLVLFLFPSLCCHLLEMMSNPPQRSAGVTAAATFAVLGSVTAFFVWGNFFLALLNIPPDDRGRHAYQTHPVTFLLISVVPSVLIALGIKAGIGLFQLRSWARYAALTWASIALVFSLSVIVLRPFETFFIPDRFVSELVSLKQLLAVSFIVLQFPLSVWWLIFFRLNSVKMQFLPAGDESAAQEPSPGSKT